MKQLAAIVLLTAVGCSTLTLVPADFSWPVEASMGADEHEPEEDFPWLALTSLLPGIDGE